MLAVPDVEGQSELFDLVAGVVDVELPGDVVARPLEDGRETVAEGAAPGIAHVDGAGGVGGDELHVHLFALSIVAAAVGVAFRRDVEQDVGIVAVVQTEVHEAGARHFGTGEVGVLEVHGLDDHGGRFRGRHAEHLRVHHGDVRGEVSVPAVGRHLDVEVPELARREVSLRSQRLDGGSNSCLQLDLCGFSSICHC